MAPEVISTVSEIVGGFILADQVNDNINIIANVYGRVGELIKVGELSATKNVSQ